MFKPGDQVICVDDSNQNDFSEKIVKGVVYTITRLCEGYTSMEIDCGKIVDCCELVGYHPVSLRYGIELVWELYRFRRYNLQFSTVSVKNQESVPAST